MFSRWFYSTLKTAENLIHQGRIDDAFNRLRNLELKEDSRTNAVLDALARPLLARARLHAQAGSYHAALGDLDRLEAIKRTTPDAAHLRQNVLEEMRHRAERQAQRSETYEEAVRHIQAGRLESGRMAVERMEDPKAREALREELDIRQRRSEQLLGQAQAALDSGDVVVAARCWKDAVQRHGRTQQSDEFARRLAPAYREAVNGWVRGGQVDRVASAAELARELRQIDPSLESIERLAWQLSQAARELDAVELAGLRESLLRIQAACGEVRWVKEALTSLTAMMEHQDQLLASPLALLAPGVEKAPRIGTPHAVRSAQNTEAVARPAIDLAAAELNARPLLLLVDGTGSCVLVSREIVRIGRAGGGSLVDVPIPADVQSHHADIVRDGDDYFLVAHGPVRVNHRGVTRSLLRDGDRVILGSNGKFEFRKPSARSETAVLVLSDRCRLREDVSQVVMLRDTCLIGPQPSSHVRTREGESRVVLFSRGGRLFVRREGADGRPGGRSEPVPLGQTLEFGDVRVTVKPYDASGSTPVA
jgi:hypothetical protein